MSVLCGTNYTHSDLNRGYNLHFSHCNSYYLFTEQQPNLSQLICFKTQSGSINVLEQIGAHYRELGVLLLNDTNGTVTQAIMGQHPEAINVNFEILQRWIQGKGKLPVEWTTLIEVLRDIKLSELAHEMEEALE